MAHLVQHHYNRLNSILLGTCFKHYSFRSSRYTEVHSSVLKTLQREENKFLSMTLTDLNRSAARAKSLMAKFEFSRKSLLVKHDAKSSTHSLVSFKKGAVILWSLCVAA